MTLATPRITLLDVRHLGTVSGYLNPNSGGCKCSGEGPSFRLGRDYRKGRVLSKKRIHKSVGVKGRNVFNLLAGTQEANRNAYPVTN